MIVCHCRRVTDRCIEHSVREGAATLRSLARDTGAGRDCGSCVGSVRCLLAAYLAEHTPPAEEVESLRATA
jgi:bacterioferritin-associated ferredoxin